MKKKLILLSGINVLIALAYVQATSAQSWNITGNNNTTPLSKLGTTNYIPLNLYTNNSERMRIDETGRVGIGTSAPVNILTVKSTAGNPSGSWLTGLTSPVFVGFADNASSEFVLATASNISPRRSVIQGRRSRGTLAAPAAVVNNDYLTSFLASGYDGSAFQNPATIDFFVDGAPSAGNVPARISFVTGTNQGNRAERLKVGSTGNFNFNGNQVTIQQATGNVGIGTTSPLSKFHIYDQTGVTTFTGIKNAGLRIQGANLNNYALLGFTTSSGNYTGNLAQIGAKFTDDGSSIDFGTSNSYVSGITNTAMTIDHNGKVGIGTTEPGFILDVAGRMRIRSDGNSAGIWLMGTSDVSFVGLQTDNSVGFYSGLGAGWGLVMNNTNGNVGIGTPANNAKLEVVGGAVTTPVIKADVTYIGNSDVRGIRSVSTPADGWGYGIEATGGYYGGSFTGAGGAYTNDVTGVKGTATGTAGTRYGVHGTATGGTTNYGIFGSASGGTTNFAGYFAGDIRVTGTYNPSDRKLKKDITSIKNSLQQLMRLKPSTYLYKTDDFLKLALPADNQMGLIADELKEVFPALVKEAVQPAEYGSDKTSVVSPEVRYDVINYVGLIPVLVASTQEQQKQIEALKTLLAEQQTKMNELMEMVKQSGTLKGITTNINSASLEQNNPNPLDNFTNIRYSIPAGSRNAQLFVSDINGKKIRQLQLGPAAKGNVSFDATGLASGTYIYSIVVDGKLVESKKMVVAK